MEGLGSPDLTRRAAAALDRLHGESPRVHCLSNQAAAALTANALLAVGAQPSLTDDPAEVEAFVPAAGALSINLGTPDARRAAAIEAAVEAAAAHGIPWVLDPVMIDRAPRRFARAEALIARAPAVVRLNETEAEMLFAGDADAAFLGVRAVSGTVDRLSQGARTVAVANGAPMLTRVTGAGCALGALTAAFLAVEKDALVAALAAALLTAIAAERAAGASAGPGSFQPAWLDALYALDAESLEREARLS